MSMNENNIYLTEAEELEDKSLSKDKDQAPDATIRGKCSFDWMEFVKLQQTICQNYTVKLLGIGIDSKAWFPYDRNSWQRFGDMSPISRQHMETITVMIIWKPRFELISTFSERPRTIPV